MSRPLDDIAPAFRAARDRWPDAPNLQQHYDDLARTFEENGSSLIELTKSFLEMVCLTVINELGATPPTSSSPTTSELLSCVLDALDLRNQRGAGALGKVISGHNKLADGLAELRNQDGTVAHGKDGFLDAISNRHARVYLLSADTIITLILNAFDGKEPSLLHTREPPDRFRHLNQRIDAGCALDAEVDETGTLVLRVLAGPQSEDDAIELRVAPSELLYYLDRQAYVSVLDALRGIEPVEAEEAEKAEASPVTSETEVAPAEAEEPEQPATARPAAGLQLLTEYQGRFADKVTPFYEFLIHSLLDGNDTQAERVLHFVYTLLARMDELAVVDWYERSSARSRVQVFVKRLVRVAKIDGIGLETTPTIIEWIAGQIPGSET